MGNGIFAADLINGFVAQIVDVLSYSS